jgi:hypothetical protein
MARALEVPMYRLFHEGEAASSIRRTRDISSHGFYFRIGQGLSVGRRFGFSIMPPWEFTQAAHAFISGRARVVRVEEVSDSSADRMGVGALMERYKFSRAESSEGAAIQE